MLKHTMDSTLVAIAATLLTFFLALYEIGPTVLGGKGLHVLATAKMVNDSSGCYLKVDKHFDVRADESDGSEWIKYDLYRDDVYTGSSTYHFIDGSMYKMVDQLFFNYHHPDAGIEKPKEDKEVY